MEEQNMTENCNKIDIIPIWQRIPIFVIALPLLLVIMPIVMVLIAFGLEVGIVVIMLEFLFTGQSKTNSEVTFGITKKETKDESNK